MTCRSDPRKTGDLVNGKNYEGELIAIINEERLRSTGSVAPGLNVSLTEFTGTFAGFTFAIQNTQIIMVASLTISVASAFSMGHPVISPSGSPPNGDLQTRLKASVYTGTGYCERRAADTPVSDPYKPDHALIFTLAVLFLFHSGLYSTGPCPGDLPSWRHPGEMLLKVMAMQRSPGDRASFCAQY